MKPGDTLSDYNKGYWEGFADGKRQVEREMGAKPIAAFVLGIGLCLVACALLWFQLPPPVPK